MQLKFKRYSGTKGLFNKKTYCLEAVLLATQAEHERITAYAKWESRLWILGDLDTDDEEYKNQVHKFNVGDLARGVRFEYENFNNVLRTENLIAKAAKVLLATVNTLATFDGTERVVEVDEDKAAVVVSG